jgi:raffinose/stachyose/melibiose transport system permease protein
MSLQRTKAEAPAAGRGGPAPAAPRRPHRRARPGLLADLVGSTGVGLIYGVLILIPLLVAVALSFCNWNGLGSPAWIGLRNWTRFFHDPVALSALVTSLKIVGLSWIVQLPLGMALGLFAAGRQRYRAVYSTLFVVPLLMSTAGTSLMWQGLLDPNLGGLHWLAVKLHAGWLQQNWLGSPTITLYVLVFLITWQFIPFQMLLFQVGRRQIPNVLYEAASLDGSTGLHRFWHITLPQLAYTIVTSTMLIVVGSLTYFDVIYILTQGGPDNTTNVLALQMYQVAFSQYEYGYASVLAVVLGVLGVVVAFALMRITGFGAMSSQQEGIG